MNLFKGKKIRSCRDKTTNKLWLSAVDVCAAIRGVDYQTARNYWKWLKLKLAKNQKESVTISHRIKMVAADGKLRQTDVVDANEAIMIINACPCKMALPFKLWLKGLAAKGEDAAQIINQTVAMVKHKTENILYTVTRRIMYGCRKIVPVYPDLGMNVQAKNWNPKTAC